MALNPTRPVALVLDLELDLVVESGLDRIDVGHGIEPGFPGLSLSASSGAPWADLCGSTILVPERKEANDQPDPPDSDPRRQDQPAR